MTLVELLGAAASIIALFREGQRNRNLRRAFRRLRERHAPAPLRDVLGLRAALDRQLPRLSVNDDYYSRPTKLPPRDAIPRLPDEPEESYEALRTYTSLSDRERRDLPLVETAHDARCIEAIRSAGLNDPNFRALCDEALHQEGVTAVDLRDATPHRERLPEDCTLAVRIDGGVLIGPSWAVCWGLRRSGLYTATV